jgi:hypothetical protein
MRKIVVIFSVVFFLFSVSFSSAESPGQEYFDTQFQKLQNSVADVKGDTTQIISILGNVFEGTVPSGGTLTGLCNKNGWSLIVLMGHNNIANPDEVAAGTKYLYPTTIEQFQVALDKGRLLYEAWLKTRKVKFKVDRIEADTVEINKLNAKVINVTEELAVKNMTVDKLRIREAEITEKLRIANAEIENLRVKNAEIDHLKIRLVEIEELRIRELAIKNALIERLEIAQLTIGEQRKRITSLAAKSGIYLNDGSKVCTLSTGCTSCDEDPFVGRVPNAVLAMYPNGAWAVEVHDRGVNCNSNSRYKAKLGYVGIDGVFVPATRADGKCIRQYSSRPLTDDLIAKLFVRSGEQLVRVMHKSAPFEDHGGQYKTTAVYVIDGR